MSSGTLRVQKISGHAGPIPGEGTQRQQQVCKLIDTTTCIGCKACEVACLEWNDLPFRDGLPEHLPDHAGDGLNYWNLIKFNEHRSGRRHDVAHAQRPVHALCRPRLPGRLPRRQRTCNIRTASWICSSTASAASIASLPVQHSKFNPNTKKMFKCAVYGSRVAGLNRPASRPAPPAACTSARRTT